MSGAADAALLDLLRLLEARAYRFVTVTPATHARVLARDPGASATTLRDMLGWSLPFTPGLDREVEALLAAADMVEPTGDGRLLARLRVSSLHGRLFLHSRYPTEAEDSVFFGPDSYRYADCIEAYLPGAGLPPAPRIVDIGGGSGVGAIVAARLVPGAQVAMTDPNPRALRFAAINAAAAKVPIERAAGTNMADLTGVFDLIMANPPFIADREGRTYRDGGDGLGTRIPAEMVTEGLPRLAPGGSFLLYCGAAIVDGVDTLHQCMATIAERANRTMDYREIDPDIFGEELSEPAYAGVERIALIRAVFR